MTEYDPITPKELTEQLSSENYKPIPLYYESDVGVILDSINEDGKTLVTPNVIPVGLVTGFNDYQELNEISVTLTTLLPTHFFSNPRNYKIKALYYVKGIVDAENIQYKSVHLIAFTLRGTNG